jgi:hypothetical protein
VSQRTGTWQVHVHVNTGGRWATDRDGRERAR